MPNTPTEKVVSVDEIEGLYKELLILGEDIFVGMDPKKVVDVSTLSPDELAEYLERIGFLK